MMQAQRHTAPKIRLYVPEPYLAGTALVINPAQSHYLMHVMRAQMGDRIAVFNGMDGQWEAHITHIQKKSVTLTLDKCTQAQKSSPDVWLIFAPIKHKMESIVEKAVELGVSGIGTVFTRHTAVKSINSEKMQLYAIEAAEQCERHDIPSFEEYGDIASLLRQWPSDRIVLYADESGAGENFKTLLPTLSAKKYAILIGPEGGFAPEERHLLLQHPQVKACCLGPRILRADTAAIAALSCLQAWLGDWHVKPRFTA